MWSRSLLFAFVFLLGRVASQTIALPACAATCLNNGAQANNCSITDLACICSRALSDTLNCVRETCSKEDVSTTLGEFEVCSSITSSSSASSSSSTTTGASQTSSKTSTTTPSTSSSKPPASSGGSSSTLTTSSQSGSVSVSVSTITVSVSATSSSPSNLSTSSSRPSSTTIVFGTTFAPPPIQSSINSATAVSVVMGRYVFLCLGIGFMSSMF